MLRKHRHNRTAPTLYEFVALGQGMLEALRYMHAKGLVHRDVKPSNFCQSGRGICIVDMGELPESMSLLVSLLNIAQFYIGTT